jgi:hypothetical protein
MIRGHVALIRQLRSFVETSGLPWGSIRIKSEYDEDGRRVSSEDSAEIVFLYGDRAINIAIWAPGTVLNGESLPLGRLVVRCDGAVVKGPIDQSTWNEIVKLIRNGEKLCPPNVTKTA